VLPLLAKRAQIELERPRRAIPVRDVPDGVGDRVVLLMYDDVRTARSPREALLEFLQTTSEVGATLAGWDRAAVERDPARA
jgi:hypothetical protein